MSKSILIFGAGINQLELIREGNKLRFTTVVIDPGYNPPGKSDADFYYKVAGDDYELTKQIALKHKIDGIVTGQMEKPLRLMAKLAQDVGYIFHTPDVIEISLDKDLMKKAFLDNKVPCAKCVTFSKNQPITKENLEDLKFPLIIKPADAFSSRGVKKVNNFEELLHEEHQTRKYSSKAKLLVEEFLEGTEYSVESITFQGETTVIQITEKFITPYPYTVEMAHLQPAQISKDEWIEIETVVKRAIKAVGINNSASHAEVMLTPDGPKMIEIGARLGGDFIASYLTKASTGISMDKASIQVALGIKPDLNQKYSRHSMIKYIELEEGKKVQKVLPFNGLYEQDGYVFSYVFFEPGETIKKITHSAERPACVLFEASDKNTLMNRIDEAEKLLKSSIVLQL